MNCFMSANSNLISLLAIKPARSCSQNSKTKKNVDLCLFSLQAIKHLYYIYFSDVCKNILGTLK